MCKLTNHDTSECYRNKPGRVNAGNVEVRTKQCHICKKNNHDTASCFFRGNKEEKHVKGGKFFGKNKYEGNSPSLKYNYKYNNHTVTRGGKDKSYKTVRFAYCKFCRLFEHETKNCKKLTRQQNKGIFCKICKKTNHEEKNCFYRERVTRDINFHPNSDHYDRIFPRLGYKPKEKVTQERFNNTDLNGRKEYADEPSIHQRVEPRQSSESHNRQAKPAHSKAHALSVNERGTVQRVNKNDILPNLDSFKPKAKAGLQENSFNAEEIIRELEEQETALLKNAIPVQKIRAGKTHKQLLQSDLFNIIFNNSLESTQTIPVLTTSADLHGDKVSVVIDTGCNLNLIHKKLIPKQNLNTQDKPKIVAANNTQMEILGSTNLTLKIGELQLQDKFYVVNNMPNQVLIGNIFLFRNNAEISYNDSTISFKTHNGVETINMDEEWSITLKNMAEHHICNLEQEFEIRSKEEIIVAPKQHTQVMIIENESRERYLLETDRNFNLTKRCHAYMIDEENGKQIKINIYNNSNTPKIIKKGMLIGHLLRQETDAKESREKKEIPIAKHYHKDKIVLTDKDGVAFDISTHLSIKEHNELVHTLKPFLHLFTTKNEDLTPAKLPPIKLKLRPDAKPVNCVPYKQSFKDRATLNELMDDLKRAGILQDCGNFTEYSSPVFLAKNKDGTSRLITDLRKINSMIVQDNHPFPGVNTILSSLANINTITRLDLKSAYHQISIHEDSRYLLTIKSTDRMYSYTRLPNGLSPASSIFSKLLQCLLQEYMYSKCLSYLDDVLTWGKDFKTDLESLKLVLKKLNEADLKLNTKKCKFMYPEINILGHTVSKAGIKPMKESIAAILDIKRPTTIRSLRSYLGSVNFFRKFLNNYASVAYPLTELLKKHNQNDGNKLQWSQECEEAFIKTKELLTNPPLLRHWREDLDNQLFVDASKTGLGAILCQKDPLTGQTHPIHYMSKKFNPAQQKYPTVELEMIAVSLAMNYFREYTLARKTTVYSDCISLQYFKNFKNPSARLNRLSMSLIDYDMEIVYKKGSTNSLADALSRNPTGGYVDEKSIDICANTSSQDTQVVDIVHLQKQDDFLKKIREALEDKHPLSQNLERKARKYIIQDDTLFYKFFEKGETRLLLVIPRQEIGNILKIFHNSSHTGAHFSYYKMLHKIRDRYFWEGMSTDILNYTKNCIECKRIKPRTTRKYGLLKPIVPKGNPLDRITIDMLGPITASHGFAYVLVITDLITRYVWSIPCRNCTAKTVADKLLNLFLQFGFPKVITHDRGTNFMSSVMQSMSESLGLQQNASPAHSYHLQGQTERFNAVLVNAISHYVKDKPQDWVKYVAPVTYAYNTARHHSNNSIPFYLMFGYKPNLPSDNIYVTQHTETDILERIKILQDVRKNLPQLIEHAQNTQKKYFDKNRTDITLNIGDEVFVEEQKNTAKPFAKFANRFEGPFTITGKLNNHTYLIKRLRRGKLTEEKVHIANLKLYKRN